MLDTTPLLPDELLKGCAPWAIHALYDRDLDFFEFTTEDVQHSTSPMHDVEIGLDVYTSWIPQAPSVPPLKGPPIGFKVLGGASCVIEGREGAEFPATLGEYVIELRRVCKGKFGIENLFGKYSGVLDVLTEKHAELRIQFI